MGPKAVSSKTGGFLLNTNQSGSLSTAVQTTYKSTFKNKQKNRVFVYCAQYILIVYVPWYFFNRQCSKVPRTKLVYSILYARDISWGINWEGKSEARNKVQLLSAEGSESPVFVNN